MIFQSTLIMQDHFSEASLWDSKSMNLLGTNFSSNSKTYTLSPVNFHMIYASDAISMKNNILSYYYQVNNVTSWKNNYPGLDIKFFFKIRIFFCIFIAIQDPCLTTNMFKIVKKTTWKLFYCHRKRISYY